MKFTKPAYASAAQVQAEFYRLATNAGIHVVLEYSMRTATQRLVRVDGVVVIGDRIVAIVACKRSPNAARRPTIQKKRYESFAVPVIVIRGIERVPAALEAVKQAMATDRYTGEDAWLEDFEA